MRPEFARAIDPVFLHVLGLLDRIAQNEAIVPHDERNMIRLYFGQAEAALGNSPEWKLAKYALVCWIDEVLTDASWTGRDWWTENVLEVEYFNDRRAYSDFFLKGQEAGTLPRKDALEVFYVCVVLGFRGLYREATSQGTLDTLEQFHLPPSLEAWTKQTSLAIRLGQGRPPIADNSRPGDGAPALQGKYLLIGTSLVTAALSAALLILVTWELTQ